MIKYNDEFSEQNKGKQDLITNETKMTKLMLIKHCYNINCWKFGRTLIQGPSFSDLFTTQNHTLYKMNSNPRVITRLNT